MIRHRVGVIRCCHKGVETDGRYDENQATQKYNLRGLHLREGYMKGGFDFIDQI
jgi:hypothetical protein